MTHKELVEIAYRWMLKNCGVGVAFKELSSLAREIPDVIGFDGWQSIVIECKVGRGDFLKDKKKPHRENGMGKWRFYCCPKGLIKVEELPAKWGLIYVDEKNKARITYDCRVKKVPIDEPYERDGQMITERWVRDDENMFEPDMMEERRMMYTALRRLFKRGLMKHIYEQNYDQRVNDINEIIELNKTQ